MKKSDARVDAQILSTYSLYEPADFLRAARLYCAKLPTMIPERWGWSEPLREPFLLDSLESLVPPSGICEMVWWQRKKKPKANGSFLVRFKSRSDLVMDTHSDITVSARLSDVDQTRLREYVAAASIDAAADIAFIESMTEEYRAYARASRSAEYGDHFFLTTHVLRHWLPDVFWLTVFGPAYVDLFGKARLLSVPAFAVEEIADNMVLVQLTPSLEDLHTDFAEVQAARALVKSHLGIDAFFDANRAYEIRKRGPIGTVFVVPRFALKPSLLEPVPPVYHE